MFVYNRHPGSTTPDKQQTSSKLCFEREQFAAGACGRCNLACNRRSNSKDTQRFALPLLGNGVYLAPIHHDGRRGQGVKPEQGLCRDVASARLFRPVFPTRRNRSDFKRLKSKRTIRCTSVLASLLVTLGEHIEALECHATVVLARRLVRDVRAPCLMTGMFKGEAD